MNLFLLKLMLISPHVSSEGDCSAYCFDLELMELPAGINSNIRNNFFSFFFASILKQAVCQDLVVAVCETGG